MERRHGERRVGRRRRGDSPADEARQGSRRRRVVTLVVVVGLLLAVPVWSGLSRWLSGRLTVPPELIGVWQTTAPGYSDRALEFTRGSVVLHTDDYHFSVHRMLRVTRERHGLYTTFRIEYQDVDAVTPLVLRLVRGAHPLLRIEHFSGVWRREPIR